MTIKYSKQFRKQFKKMSMKDQQQFWIKLEWFKEDAFDSRLRNHELKGKLRGFRSIDIKNDLRAIYEIIDGEIYLYQMIGTHAQLYN